MSQESIIPSLVHLNRWIDTKGLPKESANESTLVIGDLTKSPFPHLDPVYKEMGVTAKTTWLKCMTTWLLQFQGSLNRWAVWSKKFQNTIIIIQQHPHSSI